MKFFESLKRSRTDAVQADFEIGIPGLMRLKFSAAFAAPDEAIAVAALNRMDGHAFLFRPFELEYVGRVVNSVSLLELYISEQLHAVPPGSAVTECLSAVRAACKEFLDTAYDLEEQLTREHEASSNLALDQLFDRAGDQRVLHSDRINLLDITPPIRQWALIAALARLRVKVGIALVPLSRIAGHLPANLKNVG